VTPMPKVSQEHLAARRRQILDAALICFSRQGFHGTPMQAIFEEAGLSPGAVYRYFKSKEEIVQAIAEETLASFAGALEPGAKSPDEMLRRLLEAIESVELGEQRRRLALQVWGEAVLNPRVGDFVRRVFDGIRARLAADLIVSDPDAAARVLLAVAQGYIIQRNLYEDFDPERFRAAAVAMLSQPVGASRQEG
jgi:TetR/AcrR family transcriptional regulator, transcriptional repressor of aconitase